MVVLFVVPVEEVDGEGTGVLDGAEAGWEAWPILQGSELTFRVRVVVGDMRAAVGFGNPKITEQEGDWFGGHRRAAIGMNGELRTRDALLTASVVKELLG